MELNNSCHLTNVVPTKGPHRSLYIRVYSLCPCVHSRTQYIHRGLGTQQFEECVCACIDHPATSSCGEPRNVYISIYETVKPHARARDIYAKSSEELRKRERGKLRRTFVQVSLTLLVVALSKFTSSLQTRSFVLCPFQYRLTILLVILGFLIATFFTLATYRYIRPMYLCMESG